jgi:hypothetical protein
MLSIERDNVCLKKLIDRGENIKLKSWKFLRCANGKLRIRMIRGDEKAIDPIMGKKRVLYWEQNNNATFERKIIPRKERKRKQEMVNKLKIIKGFPKVVWDYCTFTPEEYKERRDKLKIQKGLSEIFVPKLSMEEYTIKFGKLYGAYAINGDDPFDEQEFTDIIQNYRSDNNREAISENGEVFKHREGEINDVIEWIFAPGIG